MRWLPFRSRASAAPASTGRRPPLGAQASRARFRRSGGRAEVDRSLRKALLCVLDGDFDAAESAVANAVQIDSDALDAYLALARIYRAKGELGRSIRIHQNLLLRPDLAADERNAALSQLAHDFREGGFHERAVASYEELLAQDKKNLCALAGLVELLPQVGDVPRAVAMSRRLARLKGDARPGDEGELLVRMAQAEHDEGRSDAARKLLKKITRRDPSQSEAFALLGEIEAERGKRKAALAAWSAAVRQGGEVARRVYPKLEATFSAQGQGQEYEKFVRKQLAARDGDVSARLALARTLSTRGETDSAISELRALLDREPGNLAARIALGRLLLSEHREPDAVKEFAELLTVLEGPREPTPPEPRE